MISMAGEGMSGVEDVEKRIQSVIFRMARERFDLLYHDKLLKGEKWRREHEFWFDHYLKLHREVVEAFHPDWQPWWK